MDLFVTIITAFICSPFWIFKLITFVLIKMFNSVPPPEILQLKELE